MIAFKKRSFVQISHTKHFAQFYRIKLILELK